jgi:hypothetical protein
MFSQKTKTQSDDIFYEKLDDNKQNNPKLKNGSTNFSVDLEGSSFLNSFQNQTDDYLNNKMKFCKEFKEKTNVESKIKF